MARGSLVNLRVPADENLEQVKKHHWIMWVAPDWLSDNAFA